MEKNINKTKVEFILSSKGEIEFRNLLNTYLEQYPRLNDSIMATLGGFRRVKHSGFIHYQAHPKGIPWRREPGGKILEDILTEQMPSETLRYLCSTDGMIDMRGSFNPGKYSLWMEQRFIRLDHTGTDEPAMVCPVCFSQGPFDIKGQVWMQMDDDGAMVPGSFEVCDFDAADPCICKECSLERGNIPDLYVFDFWMAAAKAASIGTGDLPNSKGSPTHIRKYDFTDHMALGMNEIHDRITYPVLKDYSVTVFKCVTGDLESFRCAHCLKKDLLDAVFGPAVETGAISIIAVPNNDYDHGFFKCSGCDRDITDFGQAHYTPPKPLEE